MSVLARRAAYLRTRARTGSVIDALAVASAEPGGAVLTADLHDLLAFANHVDKFLIERTYTQARKARVAVSQPVEA